VRTWVFLRGLTRESGHWGAFLTSFQARFPGDRVVLLDLPGNGVLHREASPWQVPEMARQCRAALLQRGVTPPYCLFAMSLGAMVATAWAVQAPAEIAAAVLVNTSLRPFSLPHQRLRPRSWATLLRLALQRPAPRLRERIVYELTCNSRPMPPRVIDDWEALHRQHPVDGINALRQIVAAARFRAPRHCPLAAPPGQAQRPVLVLASERDRLVDVSCSRRLAAAWGAAIQTHPHAGHDLPFDDGPWVAEAVRRWLAALDAPSPPATP